MKKSAVEWLIEQLKVNNYISDNAHWVIDEAKEMERIVLNMQQEQDKNKYSEESECVNMYLDDLNIPRKSEDGKEYSIVGRIKQLEKRYLKELSEVENHYLQQLNKQDIKKETQVYICPQTKLHCDDECCVSAEDCHIEAGFGIVSDCEPPKQETLEEAKEMEKEQQVYSEEEVLNFTQTILMQYKFGNTNIEQLDLLKETLEQFKKK